MQLMLATLIRLIKETNPASEKRNPPNNKKSLDVFEAFFITEITNDYL